MPTKFRPCERHERSISQNTELTASSFKSSHLDYFYVSFDSPFLGENSEG